jgi:hypothetical protein
VWISSAGGEVGIGEIGIRSDFGGFLGAGFVCGNTFVRLRLVL